MAIASNSLEQTRQLTQRDLKAFKRFRQLAIENFEEANADHANYDQVMARLNQAKHNAQQALAIHNQDIDCLNLLSRIELEFGHTGAARSLLNQCKDISPNNGAVLYSLGLVELATHNTAKAKECFERAIKIAPKQTRSEVILAHLLTQTGEYERSFQAYRELAKTHYQDPIFKSQLLSLANRLVVNVYDLELEQDLINYLQWEDANLDNLGHLVSSFLEKKFSLDEAGTSAPFEDISQCPLLLLAMERSLLKGPLVEKLLMAVRHELLDYSTQNGVIAKTHLPMAMAFIQYGLKSEYVLPMTDGEQSVLRGLQEIISQAMSQFGCNALDISGALTLYSMYFHWNQLEQYEQLLSLDEGKWPSNLIPVKKWYETQDNQRHYSFKKVTSLPDNSIQRQYERFPYPRWQYLDAMKKSNYGVSLQYEYPEHTIPESYLKNKLNVMVAGCGTGRHAVNVAKHFHNTDVTAIDISEPSLRHAKQQADYYQLDNIQFQLGDITQLKKPAIQYDVVECSGVLHHIVNHDTALNNLVNSLKNRGFIKIALYSQRARATLQRIKMSVERLNIQEDTNKLKIIRQAILNSQNLEGIDKIVVADDFYTLSGFIDMMFNEYEKHFTPLKIQELCDKHNLEWLGFCNLSQKVKQQFRDFHGLRADFKDLNQWEDFEREYPDSFPQMYQFYCQKR